MKRTAAVFPFLFFMSALFVAVLWMGIHADRRWTPNPGEAQHFWPQWRGGGDRRVEDGNPPVEWSEEKNIRWKTQIPGKGSSSPIVWKDRVYVTTTVPTGEVVEPKPSQDTFRPGAGPKAVPAQDWRQDRRPSTPARPARHPGNASPKIHPLCP